MSPWSCLRHSRLEGRARRPRGPGSSAAGVRRVAPRGQSPATPRRSFMLVNDRASTTEWELQALVANSRIQALLFCILSAWGLFKLFVSV